MREGNTMAHRYQVITYCDDCGSDEKLEYSTVKKARDAIRAVYRGYDGYAIWDRLLSVYVDVMGYFPRESR